MADQVSGVSDINLYKNVGIGWLKFFLAIESKWPNLNYKSRNGCTFLTLRMDHFISSGHTQDQISDSSDLE